MTIEYEGSFAHCLNINKCDLCEYILDEEDVLIFDNPKGDPIERLYHWRFVDGTLMFNDGPYGLHESEMHKDADGTYNTR